MNVVHIMFTHLSHLNAHRTHKQICCTAYSEICHFFLLSIQEESYYSQSLTTDNENSHHFLPSTHRDTPTGFIVTRLTVFTIKGHVVECRSVD